MNESKIGTIIRELRFKKGLTQESLAKTTICSKAFISKVENNKTTPSLDSLSRIAVALDVNISALLGEEAEGYQNIIVVKKDQRRVIKGPGSDGGFIYESLTSGKKNKAIEPFVITYPPEGHLRKYFKHEGEEIMLVLSGELKFTYGKKTIFLKEGDIVYFNPEIPHKGENNGKEQAVSLCILVPPKEEVVEIFDEQLMNMKEITQN